MNLDDEMFGKYLVRYQLKRKLREVELNLVGSHLLQEIKKLLDNGYSIQKIADQVGKKHYQVGYLVRRYIRPVD